MEIEILTKLRDNPFLDDEFENQGISEEEIAHLEQLYNNGNPFPKVLKEFLFLGGVYNPVLDIGIWDTQEEMQNEIRLDLEEVYGLIIPRPFYVVDVCAGLSLALYIYLDEDDDALLYQLNNKLTQDNYESYLGYTLSSLINSKINSLLDGESAF